MSFIDNAIEVLDRAEPSLHAVIADALAAHAYKEIATIAAMAEAVAAINAEHPRGERRIGVSVPDVSLGASLSNADPVKSVEPSWMRPKS